MHNNTQHNDGNNMHSDNNEQGQARPPIPILESPFSSNGSFGKKEPIIQEEQFQTPIEENTPSATQETEPDKPATNTANYVEQFLASQSATRTEDTVSKQKNTQTDQKQSYPPTTENYPPTIEENNLEHKTFADPPPFQEQKTEIEETSNNFEVSQDNQQDIKNEKPNEYGQELNAEDIEQLLGMDAGESLQPESFINNFTTEDDLQEADINNLESKKHSKSDKPKLKLGEQLIELGLLSEDQLDIALLEQRQTKKLIGEILVSMDFLTDSALAEVLAETSGTERFDPKTAMLDPQVIAMVPKEIASRNKVIPISIKNNQLQLAMADVYNVIAIDQVRRHLPKNLDILPIYCTDTEIQELIDQYYDYESSINGILKEIETGIRENNDNILDGSAEGYISPTVRLVNALLVDAIKAGASDIHFEPEGTFLRLRYRVDGQMTQVRSFHSDYWSAILVRIKILSEMNIAETRTAQDGRVAFIFMGREVDFRVATQPTVHGENVVMRLLDKSQALMPLDSLGFSDHNITLLKKLLKRPEGIIIVTGPTGSGKTTTLYSVLNYINSIDVNIMTLEDPVEYQLPLIRQTNIKEGSIDFLSGIKSLMRQDPDIIFVGEVRDEETALMSVRAAMTGHQVFTTLHTNDAMGAIPRLNDIGVPSHMLSGALICVLAQRLARTLCKHCKEEYVATEEDCKILGKDSNNPPNIYRSKGCNKCNNKGYSGRRAIVEILPIDKGMDELIASNSQRSTMLEHTLEHGFVPMAEDGISKVIEGIIDVKELINRIDMTDRM